MTEAERIESEALKFAGSNWTKNHLPVLWENRFKSYVVGATAENERLQQQLKIANNKINDLQEQLKSSNDKVSELKSAQELNRDLVDCIEDLKVLESSRDIREQIELLLNKAK